MVRHVFFQFILWLNISMAWAMIQVFPCMAEESISKQRIFNATADWGTVENPPQQGYFKIPGRVDVTKTNEGIVYEVYGNGDDIWGKTDEGFFVYTEKSGSWSLSAKLKWIDDGNASLNWGKACLMVREKPESASSVNYNCILRSGGGCKTSWRNTDRPLASSSDFFLDSNGQPIAKPRDGIYLRVTRIAPLNLFISEWSHDGDTWNNGHQIKIKMKDTVGYGIAVTNHADNQNLAHARIAEVKLTPAVSKIIASRYLAPTGYAEEIKVFIRIVNTSSSTKTIQIIDHPPTQYTVTEVGQNGIVENECIFWNIDVDPGATVLHYSVYPFSSDIRNATFHGTIGSDTIFGQSKAINHEIYNKSFYYLVFTGIPLVLFLIHFCLFLFNSRLREQVYYALFLLFAAATHVTLFNIPFIGTHMYEVINTHSLSLFFGNLQFAMLLLFFHKYVFQKLTWYSWLLLVLLVFRAFFWGSVYFLMMFFPNQDIVSISNDSFLAVFTGSYVSGIFFFELIRILVCVIFKKLPGKIFIVIGLFLLSIINLWSAFHIYIGLPDLPIAFPERGGYANILLLLSMSIFLAYRFAKSQKELETINLELEDRVERRTAALNQMNAELQEANAELQQLDQMKSAFVSQASHDLRTPLTAIKSSLDNVIRGVGGGLNEKQNKVIGRALNSVDRLTHLINDVLDINRIESGREVIEKQNIVFDALVKNVILENQPAAHQKNIQLTSSGLEDPCHLMIDPGKIERVVGELIGNAIKYTPDGGRVDITLTKNDTNVSLQVRDSGIGLTREDCEKVFERFYRAQSSKTMAKGSGLGLSIAKELVELHEGTLELESIVGKGTVFKLNLPVMK